MVQTDRYAKVADDGQTVNLRACPFCDEPMSGEPEFREHLRVECDEAPREVEYV
jgi:hypothetical protein